MEYRMNTVNWQIGNLVVESAPKLVKISRKKCCDSREVEDSFLQHDSHDAHDHKDVEDAQGPEGDVGGHASDEEFHRGKTHILVT
jgi:hypothetical protein